MTKCLLTLLVYVWLFVLISPVVLYYIGLALRIITRKDKSHYKLGLCYMRLFKKEEDIYYSCDTIRNYSRTRQKALDQHIQILTVITALLLSIGICLLEPVIFKIVLAVACIIAACYVLRFVNDIRVYINKSDITNKRN